MIKTKLIKTAKATILIIGGLPEDIIVDKNKYGRISFRYAESDGFKHTWNVLEDGEWEPVGFLDKITEDEAKELVDNPRKITSLNEYRYMLYNR